MEKVGVEDTILQKLEDDYYEWLKDNFKSFFDYGKPDWKRIRVRIRI
jgi:hypothetical protein